MSLPASSEMWLAILIACSVKATFLLILAWITARTARHRSAAFRHFVWTLGTLGALALPLIILMMPAWHTVVIGSSTGFWGPARAAANTVSEKWPSITSNAVLAAPMFATLASKILWLVPLVWVSGFLFIITRIAAGLFRLAWISRRSRPIFDEDWMHAVLELSQHFRIERPVRLLQSPNPRAMPLTFGIFRPKIVLPANATRWTEDRRRVVLAHELAHIARCDWFLQICSQVARGFYWFHPLVWLAAKDLRQESERACDDAVLNFGIAPSDYAHQLLDLARNLEKPGPKWAVALAFARPSNLERRFAAMMNPLTNHRRLSPLAAVLAGLVTLCFLLPLGAVRLTAQELSGNLLGAIYDPSGAAVANATIIVTNQSPNTIDMTASDAQGRFKFKALPAGEYQISVTKPGFKEYKASKIMLEPGRELSQNVTLEIGSLKEHVDVEVEGKRDSARSPESEETPSRVKMGGVIEPTKLLTKVNPVYPPEARAAGISGTVILHAVIGTDGRTLSLRVMNSQIDPSLARAAVEAVSKWRFTPTLLNGHPVEVDTSITVSFKLF